jgi:hypothetical protein
MAAPSTTGTARTNPEGHPCPPWCVIDHETDIGDGHRYLFHGSERGPVGVPGRAGYPDDTIFTRAIQGGRADDKPQVDLIAIRSGTGGRPPHAWIAPGDAGGLAAIIEMLAKASPAQHLELAAAIRAAAAVIAADAAQ